ncbi:MAG: CapA family protein [Candidatus Krumholzibacteria bacterium]|nr:CapA family protein [Candidatus Krumholzibacteria bacterium]
MVRINFMGDVMFGELLENFRCGLKTTLEKRGVDPFEHVKPILKKADLNVINLECVFSDSSIRSKPFSWILISPEKFIRYLVDNNINIVNTANNHALDHGRDAFEGSLDILDHHGIKIIGYVKNGFFQEEPVAFEIDGMRVGFLGYNISNFPDADRRRHVDRIKSIVSGVRPSFDKIVVSMHWGEEYTNIPPPYVVGFGRELLGAGCDIIHGHHSHQIQGVIQDGGRIFAPSLGNFIFDQKIEKNRITAILQVEINDGKLSYEYPACYMNELYQPVASPKHNAYIKEVTEYLADCYEEADAGAYDETVRRNVSAGHNKNRIRMRVRMLSHFWNYMPYAGKILIYKLKKEKTFSVIDSDESLDREKCSGSFQG